MTFSRLASMLRLAVPTIALALGLATAFALASCGGEDAKLLPGSTAAEISENLDTVRQLASEGECVGAADAADQVSAQVEALADVDPKLKLALERGAARLNEVVTTCEEGEIETETVSPEDQTEETGKLPPGQVKKEEKEREKEERALEKEEEKAEATKPPPAKGSPEEEESAPPSEGGGTGAPGGVSPATPAPEDE
jgi:hypothetical protein